MSTVFYIFLVNFIIFSILLHIYYNKILYYIFITIIFCSFFFFKRQKAGTTFVSPAFLLGFNRIIYLLDTFLTHPESVLAFVTKPYVFRCKATIVSLHFISFLCLNDPFGAFLGIQYNLPFLINTTL